ncbi:MAG: dihydropteroate synthase-like protein [Candidatus Hecatellaceae archaeon]
MKVLVVTGIKAKELVESQVAKASHKVEGKVFVLPVPVAALITPAYAARMLSKSDVEGFDLVLLPGTAKGDVTPVAEKLGIPVFKGPRHASDIADVLEQLGEIKLSTVKPACEMAAEIMREKARRVIEALRREARRKPSVLIKRGKAVAAWAPKCPPIILAEIADASKMSDSEIEAKARYYVASGASMVDVGMEAGGGRPDEARRAVKAVRRAVKVPVSIDSADAEELEAGVKAGANLILSGDSSNLRELAKFARKTWMVVTPAGPDGAIPERFDERVSMLEENLRLARELGLRRLIADPILGLAPPYGLMDSLLGYWEFSRRNPSTPTFFGAGNVTELSDVDSPGLNFALALLGWELNVSFIFTVEASRKTLGSVWELSRALEMIVLASEKRAPPKDLGVNLLRLKEKRAKDEPLTEDELKLKALEAEDELALKFPRDPKGSFKIKIDRREGFIYAFHYERGSLKPSRAVRGRRPEPIYRKIVEEGLVSLLDHAAYLGFELGKAYIALKTGRSYVQDEDVFA